MIDGHIVIDATVHPYDLGPNNALTGSRASGLYVLHQLLSSNDEYMLTEAEMFSDFDLDAFTWAIFAESQVDYAGLHSLPNLGVSKGDLTLIDRMAELRDRYPQRYMLYGNVTPPAPGAIERLERQVDEHQIDALKLYPAAQTNGAMVGWSMDDVEVAFPVFERAQELGLSNVAIHKAVIVGRAEMSPFRVSDVEAAARAFPDISFEVVHAGWAFLEETIQLMISCPNVYGNLELVFSYIVKQPRRFAEIIGEMLFWGLTDRLIYADGCNVVHPQPGLKAFASFQMPADLVEGKGYPEITETTRAQILGGNFARIHGMDLTEIRAKVEGDEFEVAKGEGLADGWSRLRAAQP